MIQCNKFFRVLFLTLIIWKIDIMSAQSLPGFETNPSVELTIECIVLQIDATSNFYKIIVCDLKNTIE